jgi:WD40 repeat protein
VSATVSPSTASVWDIAVDDAPVALSCAGGLVAVAGAEGTVWVGHAATGAEVRTFQLPGGALRVALAPDGGQLAATGPTGHVLWRCADGQATWFDTGAWSSTAAWSGNHKVAVASGRRAFVLDETGAELWSTEPAPSTVTDLAWMRQGRRLAVAAYGAVRCHERHTSAPVATYPYVGSHLTLAIAPTGRWICSGNQDASIHIWRTRDADELTMSGYPEKVSRLAFDDTGRWLAADGAPDITVWDFSGKGPEGRAPRCLTFHDTITAIAWRPNSYGHLASGDDDGTIALWRATAGRPGQQVRPADTITGDPAGRSAVAALAWAGPSTLIAAHRDGRVQAHQIPADISSRSLVRAYQRA